MPAYPPGNQSSRHTRSRFSALLCRNSRYCLDIPSSEKSMARRRILADNEKDMGQRSLDDKLPADNRPYGLAIFQYISHLFPADQPPCPTSHRHPDPHIHSHRGAECSRPLSGNPDRGLRKDSILPHPYPDNYISDVNAPYPQFCILTSMKPSEHQDFICPSSS